MLKSKKSYSKKVKIQRLLISGSEILDFMKGGAYKTEVRILYFN